jgi:hypothetical protein
VTSRLLGVAGVAIALVGCGGNDQGAADRLQKSASANPPLRIRELRASVVRMGSFRHEPLLGVRLRAAACARSNAEGDRIYPTSFRVAHFVVRRPRAPVQWKRPFRVMSNNLHWLVPFGETRGMCGAIEFEDVIPPNNYGGVESSLGYLHKRCYGVHLTINAVIVSTDDSGSTPISASGRAIVQCGRFRRG